MTDKPDERSTPKPILKKPVSVPVSPPALTLTPATIKVSLSKTNPRDLDRQRADIAWQNIQAVKSQSYEGKYSSLARKIPTLIQINGLAQTLAFLKSKGKEHHIQAFNHLSSWCCIRFNWDDTSNLLNKIIHMDSQTYRLTTSEVLAFLQWLKRFAEADLISEEENL